jgi:hypothetical protein
MKRITLDLEEDMYKNLKILCVNEGCSMVDVIRELLESRLEKGRPSVEGAAELSKQIPISGTAGRLDYAESAIQQLKNIFINDAEFTEAHEHVKAWINTRVPGAQTVNESDDKSEEESWAKKDSEYMTKTMSKRYSKDFGPCIGMRYAEVAITELEKMPDKDIGLRRSCRRVLSFIDTRLAAFKSKK